MPYHTLARMALATAIATPSLIAFADDPVGVAPVVVTATRTAQTADESLASVSVITRADIERTQATSLPELLGRVQGVEFSQSGGRGKTSSLFIRGTNSDHTIVLIDGVRIGSATAGTTAFETLPLDNIERIEIVRGPRSSLYGSDAIGGVIQIFTRQSDAPRAAVTTGSHDYRRASAGFGRQGEAGGFSVDVSAEETDGFDVHENDPADPFFGSEPDDDGFESVNISLRGTRRLSPDVEISGTLLVADAESEFDGTAQNSTEQRQTVGSVGLDWTISERWQSHVTLGRSSDDSDNFLDGDEVSHFDTSRTTVDWQNDVTLGAAQLITVGIDFLRDEIDTSEITVFPPPTFTPTLENFEVTERETIGVYVQHQWTGARLDSQLSLRHESFDEGFDNPDPGGDRLDDETTGSAALGYRITEGVRVFTSYGTAFRAPSFNELFFPGFGNPDLDPEDSETLEVGLRGDAGIASWEVVAYRTEIDNLIQTAEVSPGVFAPENVDEAEIQGIEIGVDAAWDQWLASLNADFKDPEDSETGEQLPRRAKHTLRGSLTRTVGLWSVGGDVQVQGERFDSNGARLDSYALIDLRAAWQFAPEWRASFKINNAGDANYQLVDGFNRDERNFLLQADWRPGS